MSIFSKVRPLQDSEKIVTPDGRPSLTFQRLWQQLIGNPEALDESKIGTTRRIDTDATLTGGGDLSADLTLGIDTTAEAERVRDVIGSALVAGANITITVDDGADTITIAATGGGGSGSWIPLVDGSEPPVFITDGAGVLILVAGP